MKQNEFKKMIKEAVREVFQEEMKELLLEAVRSPKTVVTENIQPMQPPKPSIPIDIKRNLRNMIGGEFDTTISANSSMIQSSYTPPPISTVGEGSSLPPGEVSLDQIIGIMNK